MIIDTWAQHPTLRHSQDAMFDSLRRWTHQAAEPTELPVSATIQNLDEGGIEVSLLSAWVSPKGAMISNDEVAGFVK